ISSKERENRYQQDITLKAALESPSFDFDAFLEKWYKNPIFGSLSSQSYFPELKRSRKNQNPQDLAWALDAFSTGKQPSCWEIFQSPPCPILYIAGASDPIYSGLATDIQKSHSKVSTHIVPNSGHNVHLSSPVAYTALIRSFLS
ncbi:MAG: hypothetical protein HRT90_11920, partial [Candidatus Margulisbacteria bacterium]|nr:hypothetical protein [Candidatus Margulisiibacteriota bacterium]